MINEIVLQVDKTISLRKDNPELRKIVLSVISNSGELPPKFVKMCYSIHEADTDTELDEKIARENNLHTLDWFIQILEDLKKENIEFWDNLQ